MAIIGDRMWEREFERHPGVLGRSLRVDGREHTIVGVAPPGTLGLRAPAVLDLWVPIEGTAPPARRRGQLPV